MDNQIILTLTEAIVKHKEDIQELQSLLDMLQSETKATQDEVIKTKEVLEQRIDDLIISTQKMVDKVATSIKPEAVDYNRLEISIKAKINRYLTDKDADITELRADLKDFVISNLSKFKPKDGKDADNEKILSELKSYILENKSDFRGAKGIQGESVKGDDGKDGVGIEDIYKDKNGYLVIELTNGEQKSFKLPSSKVVSGGGGGINFNGLTELTTVLDTDYLVLLRNNLPYKVSVNTLKGVFGAEVIDNVITTEDGAYLTNENGVYLEF